MRTGKYVVDFIEDPTLAKRFIWWLYSKHTWEVVNHEWIREGDCYKGYVAMITGKPWVVRFIDNYSRRKYSDMYKRPIKIEL